jgi:hypothetical protein
MPKLEQGGTVSNGLEVLRRLCSVGILPVVAFRCMLVLVLPRILDKSGDQVSTATRTRTTNAKRSSSLSSKDAVSRSLSSREIILGGFKFFGTVYH